MLDLSKPEKIFFPIMAAISQFFVAFLSQPKKDKNQKKVVSKNAKPGPDFQTMMTKQMMFFFPVMIAFISFSLPSGLVLYWIVTNIFMIVQQVIVNKKGSIAPRVAVSVKSRK
jgi:YidC/Oxa1 family membrane protein insertase